MEEKHGQLENFKYEKGVTRTFEVVFCILFSCFEEIFLSTRVLINDSRTDPIRNLELLVISFCTTRTKYFVTQDWSFITGRGGLVRINQTASQ
jgi:hypothetical protein